MSRRITYWPPHMEQSNWATHQWEDSQARARAYDRYALRRNRIWFYGVLLAFLVAIITPCILLGIAGNTVAESSWQYEPLAAPEWIDNAAANADNADTAQAIVYGGEHATGFVRRALTILLPALPFVGLMALLLRSTWRILCAWQIEQGDW